MTIRPIILAAQWYEVYNLIEFIAQSDHPSASSFVERSNEALARHVSAYRFIGNIVTPITSEEEINEIEIATAHCGVLSPISTHINAALKLLSNRTDPDYRNAIKESISAVEAACKILTNDANATLGQALKKLELHGALERGFSALYGWTSDAEGIRHSLLEESKLTADDAKYFVIACSAFVNYLIAKASLSDVHAG